MKTALVRPPGPALLDCALTHVERQPIDFARASRQHESYVAALSGAGLNVVRLPAMDALADAAFVEDTAVVLKEVAILSRPRLPARQAEIASVAAVIRNYREVREIVAPATLEGGDVLVIGRKIFIGLSSRTNRDGIDQFTEFVNEFGYSVVAVEIKNCLHLKTACTYVGQETVLLNPKWVASETFSGLKLIEVHASEPYAANTLLLPNGVWMPQAFPKTREILAAAKFKVEPLDISEFAKAEAGLSCLSLIIG